MSDGSCKESLSSTWGSVKKDTLRLRNTQAFEDLRMLNGQLNDLLDFLNLLFKTTNHVISGIGNFLNFHESDKRVDLAWHDLVKNVTGILS